MWTEKEVEKYIEEEIKNGTPLGKLLESDSEKKKAYKFKMLDSQTNVGYREVNDLCPCKTCAFAEIIKPIGRQPQTRYCRIYEPDDSHGKPDEVLYEGEECEYYEKEE